MDKDLKAYCEHLIQDAQQHPISGQRNSEGFCKTLWIPYYSGNRTYVFNLNHQVIIYHDRYNLGVGENGNCMTPYCIIEVPPALTEDHLKEICRKLCIKLNKPSTYPKERVLKGNRVKYIIDEIENEFPGYIRQIFGKKYYDLLEYKE